MRHAEWLGNDTVIAVAKEGPGRHVIFTLPVAGGAPTIVHRYATEHDFSGSGRVARWQVRRVCRAGDRRLLPDLHEGDRR